jgi:hypothetical protein
MQKPLPGDFGGNSTDNIQQWRQLHWWPVKFVFLFNLIIFIQLIYSLSYLFTAKPPQYG